MPVGKPIPTTPRYGAKITTVDPAQALVEGVLADGQARPLSVYTTTSAFRWPMVGEAWMVEQKNGSWYLDSFYPTKQPAFTYKDVAPGDLVLSTPTGAIHVLGSEDGSTDFQIAKSDVATKLWPQQTSAVTLVLSGTYSATVTFASNGWHTTNHTWQPLVALENGTSMETCTWAVNAVSDTSITLKLASSAAASGTVLFTMMTSS